MQPNIKLRLQLHPEKCHQKVLLHLMLLDIRCKTRLVLSSLHISISNFTLQESLLAVQKRFKMPTCVSICVKESAVSRACEQSSSNTGAAFIPVSSGQPHNEVEYFPSYTSPAVLL